MLREAAEGVLVQESQFCKSNAVVVMGGAGVLLIDPGILGHEMEALARDLRDLGQPVVAGFSTHPHWDHLLWHAQLGPAPRYGTARGAATVQALLSTPNWEGVVAQRMPPDVAAEVLLDLFGLVTGLPEGATYLPWHGPRVRIIEHRGHAPGHAALLIEERGVLVAGDMLSDVLVPLLDVGAPEPLEDYLAGLRLLEDVGEGVEVLVPGHGSVGGTGELHRRIEQDRAYLDGLTDAAAPTDPRTGPSATYTWVAAVHQCQLRELTARGALGNAPR